MGPNCLPPARSWLWRRVVSAPALEALLAGALEGHAADDALAAVVAATGGGVYE